MSQPKIAGRRSIKPSHRVPVKPRATVRRTFYPARTGKPSAPLVTLVLGLAAIVGVEAGVWATASGVPVKAPLTPVSTPGLSPSWTPLASGKPSPRASSSAAPIYSAPSRVRHVVVMPSQSVSASAPVVIVTPPPAVTEHPKPHPSVSRSKEPTRPPVAPPQPPDPSQSSSGPSGSASASQSPSPSPASS